MSQITVFPGPERRRRWSEEDRLRILAEAFAPGACVAELHHHGITFGECRIDCRQQARQLHREQQLRKEPLLGAAVYPQIVETGARVRGARVRFAATSWAEWLARFVGPEASPAVSAHAQALRLKFQP